MSTIDVLGLTPKQLLDGGAFGLLLLLIFLFFVALSKGWLYTGSAVDKIERNLKDQVATAEEREAQWRAVAEKWSEALTALSDGQDDYLEQGRTMITLLNALVQPPEFVSAANHVPRHRRRG